MSDQTPSTSLGDWCAIRTMLAEHPDLFTSYEAAKRACKDRDRNGLTDAVRLVGRRFLIHRGRLAAWIDQQTDKRPSGRKAKLKEALA